MVSSRISPTSNIQDYPLALRVLSLCHRFFHTNQIVKRGAQREVTRAGLFLMGWGTDQAAGNGKTGSDARLRLAEHISLGIAQPPCCVAYIRVI